ncbi:hypothetical protein L873DRAFT_1039009 [Choiromyces venosus 120613-1]|uniref:Uncharacterized protein n=1 Tax=Choiromyces venosus 120613-1 TaxID=1336337 RepID=A0A3N4JNI7_9PEZI|nr:hypothetical protein L873DRAFT_1039009 [Choiromyces venosus 120613-1]
METEDGGILDVEEENRSGREDGEGIGIGRGGITLEQIEVGSRTIDWDGRYGDSSGSSGSWRGNTEGVVERTVGEDQTESHITSKEDGRNKDEEIIILEELRSGGKESDRTTIQGSSQPSTSTIRGPKKRRFSEMVRDEEEIEVGSSAVS